MGLVREPQNVDFIIKSEPWTDKELSEFREIMKQLKTKNVKRKLRLNSKRTKKQYA